MNYRYQMYQKSHAVSRIIRIHLVVSRRNRSVSHQMYWTEIWRCRMVLAGGIDSCQWKLFHHDDFLTTKWSKMASEKWWKVKMRNQYVFIQVETRSQYVGIYAFSFPLCTALWFFLSLIYLQSKSHSHSYDKSTTVTQFSLFLAIINPLL